MSARVLFLLLLAVVTPVASAQGPGFRGGRGGRGGAGMAGERAIFHELLSAHDAIERVVEEIPGGVKTITTTEDPELVAALRSHVESMHHRLVEGRPVRRWDPLFRELFDAADRITMRVNDIPNGVEVMETSEDPRVVELLRAHARVVTGFVNEGFDEAHRSHDPPAPQASPEQGAAWLAESAAFDRLYIPALALTNQQKDAPSRSAIKTLAAHTATLGDPELFEGVADRVAEAQRLIEAGELQAAHETLEPIRDLLAERRREAGVAYPLDALAEFHAVMEEIVKPASTEGGPGEEWFTRLPGTAAEASAVWARVEQVRFSEASLRGDEASAKQRESLIAAEREALSALNRAIRDGDKAATLGKARGLKPPFAKLYMSFGDFPGAE